jgi:hypothetical protein
MNEEHWMNYLKEHLGGVDDLPTYHALEAVAILFKLERDRH